MFVLGRFPGDWFSCELRCAFSQMYQPVPESLPFNMVLTFVEELPAEDAPDIFGMTDNAEKACREMQASKIIHTLVDVQPRITHVKGRLVSSSSGSPLSAYANQPYSAAPLGWLQSSVWLFWCFGGSHLLYHCIFKQHSEGSFIKLFIVSGKRTVLAVLLKICLLFCPVQTKECCILTILVCFDLILTIFSGAFLLSEIISSFTWVTTHHLVWFVRHDL